MLTELVGVVFKEAKRRGFSSLPTEVSGTLEYLVYGDYIKLIYPVAEDIEIAFSVIRSGLKDIFDAILYATSVRTGIRMITFDTKLLNFLKRNGFETENIIIVK